MKKHPVLWRTILFGGLELVMMALMIFAQTRMEDPWKGVLQLVVLLGMALGWFFFNRKAEKEEEERFDQEMEVQNEGLGYDETLSDDAYKPVPYLFLLHSASGSIYQLLRGQNQYHFIKVGGELSGIREERILEHFTSDVQIQELDTKHFSVNKAEIVQFQFEPKHCVSTQLPNCGTVTFVAPKKKRYILLDDELSPEKVETFFYDLKDRMVIDTQKREKQKMNAEQEQQIGAWRRGRQNSETFKKLKALQTALVIISIVAALNLLIFALPSYEISVLICLFCYVVAFVLTLVFPAYVSLVKTSAESIKNNRAKCISMLAPFLISGAALMLSCFRNFNFLSWERLALITVGVGIVLTAILVCFTREVKKKIIEQFSLFFVLSLFSVGVVGELNYLLDFRTAFIEDATIVDKYVSSGSKSADEERFVVKTESGEEWELAVSTELYDALETGDDVDVLTCQGAFGIPYADVYFDGELDDWVTP